MCSAYIFLQIPVESLQRDINTFNAHKVKRGKGETPSARPSLSRFEVLMKWSLSVRQASHLHVGTFLLPCTALIRWARYALHVLCRLEKEKWFIYKYRWTFFWAPIRGRKGHSKSEFVHFNYRLNWHPIGGTWLRLCVTILCVSVKANHWQPGCTQRQAFTEKTKIYFH